MIRGGYIVTTYCTSCWIPAVVHAVSFIGAYLAIICLCKTGNGLPEENIVVVLKDKAIYKAPGSSDLSVTINLAAMNVIALVDDEYREKQADHIDRLRRCPVSV